MRRPRTGLLAAAFGLLLLGATPHPDKQACLEVRAGLDGASPLSKWVSDETKAERLRQAFETVHFHGIRLATALESGASIESTSQIHQDFVAAGRAFLLRARALEVNLPSKELETYLERTRACSQPY